MDRVGTRIGLATIFAAWSVVGGAHALVASLAGFIVLRFLMGLTECGNYTAGIKAIAGLFPGASRSTAGGVFNAGAQLGSVIAPLLVLALLREKLGLSVPMTFIVPTALGLLWLLPWLSIFPDKEKMAAVSLRPAGATSTPGPAIGLGQLIRNHKVLGLFLIRVFSGPITTFYWTWLPQYLRTGRGMSFLAIGIFASLPNMFGMTGNVVGGLLTDRLVRMTGSIDRGRKLGFACAFGLGALSMVMPFVANDYAALGLMGLALFGNQWVAATYIGAVGDIVPQQLAGRVNGIAGFGDSSSTLLAVLLTGAIVDRYPSHRCSSVPACCPCWPWPASLRHATDRAGDVRSRLRPPIQKCPAPSLVQRGPPADAAHHHAARGSTQRSPASLRPCRSRLVGSEHREPRSPDGASRHAASPSRHCRGRAGDGREQDPDRGAPPASRGLRLVRPGTASGDRDQQPQSRHQSWPSRLAA